MVIIACPECGNKISDRAEICPHCGLPRRFFNLPNSDTIVELPQNQLSGNYKSIKAMLIAFSMIGAVSSALRSRNLLGRVGRIRFNLYGKIIHGLGSGRFSYSLGYGLDVIN